MIQFVSIVAPKYSILFYLMNLMTWSANGQTNYLFIVVDDLRPALGCYGDTNAYTPNIDKMAGSSFLFNRAYAQLALCAPSRNSILTSRRPDTLQLYDFYSYWRNTVGNFTTLPEHLKNYGYTTKSVGKIFHPGISSNGSDDFPYSWSEKPFHPFTNRFKNSPVCGNGRNSSLQKNLVCPVKVSEMPGETLPDLETLNAAKIFIKNQSNKKNPFFLAVGFQKPHIPLKYPQKYLKYHPLDKFKLPTFYEWPKNVSSVAYNPWTDLRKRHDVENLLLRFPWEKIPVNFGKKILQSYYAAVTYIDDLIGILLNQLRVSRLHENTLIVLTSDHGWSLGEHAEWAKYSNFEVALRVPLIISIPKKKSSSKTTNIESDSVDKILENGHELDTTKNITKKRSALGRLLEIIKSIQKRNEAHSESSSEKFNIRIDALVELVDLFPTIAEISGHKIETCPDYGAKNGNLKDFQKSSPKVCTEGISLVPLIEAYLQNRSLPWKKGVFSQYPRPGLEPTLEPNSDEPRLDEITVMGYSLRTRRFRYTAWINFSPQTKAPNWNKILAEELYDHNIDPSENANIAENPIFIDVKKKLMSMLRSGWRKSLPYYDKKISNINNYGLSIKIIYKYIPSY